MEILIIILAYIWLGVLHSCLIGTFIFGWFGKKINDTNMWKWALLIFGILLFFETYWIPIFNALQIKVFINADAVLQFFKITNTTNIVEKLGPGFITVISCALQTIAAIYLGKKYLQIKK